MKKFNSRSEFEIEYKKLSVRILELEQERTRLLSTYRNELGMTAEDRVLVVKELWPNREEILKRTGLSLAAVKATASHLGLTSHPKKLDKKTISNRLAVQRLGGVS